MNILFITATYPPSANGVSLSTARITEELRQLGHMVGIVGPATNHLPNDISYYPLPIIKNTPFLPKDYPVALLSLSLSQKKALQKIPWDIIHVQHPHMISLALSIKKMCSAPIVFTYHTQYDTYIDEYGWWLPQNVRSFLYTKGVIGQIKKTDGVVVLVRWLKNRIEKLVQPTSVYHIPTTGVPPVFFRPTIGLPLSMSTMHHPVFLTVSRLSKEKNLDFLLFVMKNWLAHKKGDLVIIGDGLKKKKLQKLTRSLGIAAHVHFLGKVSDEELAAWHQSSDLLLFTSISETSPMTILEAMAGGLPVVAIEHEAPKEVIKHGKNGMLVRNDPLEFIRAMEEALKVRVRLSTNAQKTAGAYTIEKSAKKLLSVYEKVISDSKA